MNKPHKPWASFSVLGVIPLTNPLELGYDISRIKMVPCHMYVGS